MLLLVKVKLRSHHDVAHLHLLTNITTISVAILMFEYQNVYKVANTIGCFMFVSNKSRKVKLTLNGLKLPVTTLCGKLIPRIKRPHINRPTTINQSCEGVIDKLVWYAMMSSESATCVIILLVTSAKEICDCWIRNNLVDALLLIFTFTVNTI